MGESILFFSWVSLLKFSLGALYIYIGVCLECKELVFPKQSGLATWPRNLTELRV